MRILIDLQGCQSGSRFGGIGRYSMSLAKAMLRIDSGHEIYLLLNSRLPNENFIRAEFAGLMPQQHIFTFDVPAYVAAENNLPANTLMAELIREKRIAEIDPDVLHIASLFEGAGEDVVTSVGMLFPAERTAVTLYDLIPFLEQETYLTNQMLADHYLRKFEALTRAGMIVSISEFSREEALTHTTIPADRIVNISSAVDEQFTPCVIGADARHTLLTRWKIEKPFLMFTGSFDVRKNHERLVKAFALVPTKLREQYQLVIVGKGKERQLTRLRKVAQSHGLDDRDLVFVGHVTDADLVALYNLCSLFVFPSLHEGFGLPVLEAMSCGVATIGSNRTSVPEVIGRADALFDPEDVDDIAAKITSVLSNTAFREDLKQHGLEQAKNFSWALSAERALAFFEGRCSRLRMIQSVPLSRSMPLQNQNEMVYENFLAILTKLKLGKLDDEFLASTVEVIAANELRNRIESEHFHSALRIGWVTGGDAECEINACSRRLMEALPSRPTVFAPYSIKKIDACGNDVIQCWNSGAWDELSQLQAALASAPVDAVVIQYGDGTIELSSLVGLVTQQKKLQRHVFVILHSCIELSSLTAETGLLETRVALKACDGIFVYAMSEIKNLGAFKITKNVNFLSKIELQCLDGKSVRGDQAELHANYFLNRVAFAIASASGNA